MGPEEIPLHFLIFPSQLGWMAVVWRGQKVRGLTFGHEDPVGAGLGLSNILGSPLQRSIPIPIKSENCLIGDQTDWYREATCVLPQNERVLMERLRSYAQGKPVEFNDIPLDPGPTSPFQAKVYAFCRQIPFGSTITYGQLAQLVGSPGAARAVGQCLARNPIPILIPCHRVVGSGKKLGGFTAPGGLQMKKRLLQLEANALQLKESLALV
ncbi:MAG: MGMT family protein [Thermoguttaceae bacterium]|nr:MGMT family protein [Thermoguttaceae bacterium]MDW8036865.1 MGMT family protein [Thermoguttaceae bacterium]